MLYEVITDDLRNFGTVDIDTDQVIVCVVGDLVPANVGYANQVLGALKDT